MQKAPEQVILSKFPKLALDTAFKITSPCNPDYNCIAWAAVKDNIFLWPYDPKVDGIDWPGHLPCDTRVTTFIQLYTDLGYVPCSDHTFEEGYQKIAIYVDPTTSEVKHAARQKHDGYWTSKLGPAYDIQHVDPFTLEGTEYGFAIVFMKRPNPSFTRNPRTVAKYQPRSKRKKKKK